MDFVSLTFGIFLLIGVIVYYCIPKNKQWILLLILGMFFYAWASVKLSFFIVMSILTSYGCGVFLEKIQKPSMRKLLLWFGITGNGAVLLFLKVAASGTPVSSRLQLDRFAILLPMGISFYTLQIIGYMVDVYHGKIKAEKNLLKYSLFVSFFPQILQGPIPRYKDLAPQLLQGHSFEYDRFTKGLQLMLWGFFQKLVIADRANIVVNRLFGEYESYKGIYVLLAGVLYSIQLYTDFSGCVCIAKGAAALFGIEIQDNFRHPYFSTSIQEFWRRWHISLSNWLRDYIYIPLGGNRKGVFRKYVNIMITFLVSGIWHGIGSHYILWGLMHGGYQVLGSVLMPVRDKAVKLLKIDRDSFSHRLFKTLFTCFFVMVAWIVFRADSISMAVKMLINMVTVFNPWILVNGDLYLLGISGMEFRLLWICIGILLVVSLLQEKLWEKGSSLREAFAKQGIVFRWTILFGAIFAVLIFGVYGPGYDAAQFIYGNF